MNVKVEFSGPVQYRIRSMAVACKATAEVLLRRRRQGPRLPTWNVFVELTTQMMKAQLTEAFNLHDVRKARLYLDSMVINWPVLSEVTITPLAGEEFKGSWFVPRAGDTRATLLYLHGGGYAFCPKSYRNLIAHITVHAKTRTFALDYRLAPEHRFPAQLEDTLNAYRFLLEDTGPGDLIVAGDSAGAHLTLGLLLKARDAGLPLPVLAIAISPPTDFDAGRAAMSKNAEFDFIDPYMLQEWSRWFCDPERYRDPPLCFKNADLRGLPPIYIQAGGLEILYDSIRAFAENARARGADVTLETWHDMPHDFQLFGEHAPQSAAALKRIAEVIESHTGVRSR
ncbi:MAG: alpha/beta hydrolase [Terriglobales bacterium]